MDHSFQARQNLMYASNTSFMTLTLEKILKKYDVKGQYPKGLLRHLCALRSISAWLHVGKEPERTASALLDIVYLHWGRGMKVTPYSGRG